MIEMDGSIHKGRPIEQTGAHCAEGGHNRHSIGVCYVGGCAKDGKTPKDTRTPEQKESLAKLLKELQLLLCFLFMTFHFLLFYKDLSAPKNAWLPYQSFVLQGEF